jgi:hypothetical protein
MTPAMAWAPFHNARQRTFTAYCTNPACAHARAPHPITGHVDVHGGFDDPGSATSECPGCGSPLESIPLFATDEPYMTEEAA